MSVAIEFFFNFVLTVLLGCTVGYCWLLNRRIRIIQDSRTELAELLKHFDESTTRASESILALQSASKKIGETIQNRIDKAHYAIDDLTFLLERAEKASNAIEAGISVARQKERITPQMEKEVKLRPTKMDMEEPLAPVQPLVRPKIEAPRIKVEPREEAEMPAKTMASLQAMLDKLGKRKVQEPSATGTSARRDPELAGAGKLRPRSQAEEELLQIIRGGNKS